MGAKEKSSLLEILQRDSHIVQWAEWKSEKVDLGGYNSTSSLQELLSELATKKETDAGVMENIRDYLRDDNWPLLLMNIFVILFQEYEGFSRCRFCCNSCHSFLQPPVWLLQCNASKKTHLIDPFTPLCNSSHQFESYVFDLLSQSLKWKCWWFSIERSWWCWWWLFDWYFPGLLQHDDETTTKAPETKASE